MSKQNRRSGRSFRTLGQRMLSFGRGIMRTYANETSLQPDTSSDPSRPRGQWRSMSNSSLIWRQEQSVAPATSQPALETDADFDYSDSDYFDYDDMGQPIQRQPQPRRQQPRQPIQRQPQPPTQQPSKSTPAYIKSPDGTPVKVSRKRFSSDLQRRLESIAVAHQEKNAVRELQRDKKIESIQRKVDKGELTPRRRGSIEVDYVQTDSLLPPEERGKKSTPIQTQRQDSSESDSSPPASDSLGNSDDADESQWFDEVPDDDTNIDQMAGFESAEDDIQRLPDDLPRFDASSLSEEDTPNDMGEFEGGYDNFPSQSADLSTTINRDFDDDSEQRFHDDVDSSFEPSANIQHTPQDFTELPEFDDGDNDETVPLVPNYDAPASRPTPSTDTPIQRTELEPPDINDNDVNSFNELPAVESTPVQRDTVQRDIFDETTFDDHLAHNESDLSQHTANDSPIQRDTLDETTFDDHLADNQSDLSQHTANDSPIQRDTLDETTFDDDFAGNDSDLSQHTANDSPIQRDTLDETTFDDHLAGNDSDLSQSTADNSSLQRDTLDETTFDDHLAHNDSDLSQPTANDSPIQRDTLDETTFDDHLAHNDSDLSQPTANDSPIQRDTLDETTFDDDLADNDSDLSQTTTDNSSLQRDTLDETTFDDHLADNQSDLSQPTTDNSSIQRDIFDETTFDDHLAHNDSDLSQSVPDNSSLQRDSFHETTFDDDGVYNDSDLSQSIANESPVQRDISHETATDNNNYHDVDSHYDKLDSLSIQPVSDEPTTRQSNIQRTPSDEPPAQHDDIDHSDLGNDGDYSDYGDETWAEHNNYSPLADTSSGDVPVQRETRQPATFDDDADSFDSFPTVDSTSDQVPIQREAVQHTPFDEPILDNDDDDATGDIGEDNKIEADFDAMDSPNIQPASDTPPVQRQQSENIRRSEMDERTFEDIGDMDSLSIQPPSQDTPVQRRVDMPMQHEEIDDVENYNSYGDETWAEANNYSPATDSASSPNPSLQRDIDESAPSMPHVDGDFDHLEDTDSMTAMNILDDYLTEHQSTSDTSSSESAPVQRAYEDENDYLPDDFDPTPTIYDFNQANDQGIPSASETPIQRTPQDDMQSNEQPIDLFQALSQAGMIDTPRPTTPQAPIQRDYQADADYGDPDDYSNYGDATWAEVNHYTPATVNDAPVQRVPQDGMGGDDQPMDLFQAMSQAGMIDTPPSHSTTPQTPIQRTPQDDNNGNDGWNSEAIDLYNAMIQSGMIQDSSKAEHSTSSSSEPIQRVPQAQPDPEPSRDMMDMLARATQVSESSANNSSSPSVDTIARKVVQRTESAPISPSDTGITPETERQNTDKGIEKDDKEYLSQIARDVFRVIKRRLREEKERRG